MELPDFLKIENRKPVDDTTKEFLSVLDEYIDVFGDGIPSAVASYSDEQWISIMKKCIKRKKTYEELYGYVLEEDAQE